MAQHGAAGWAHGPVGPGMDGNNPNGHDGGFVGHVDHNTGSYLEGPANHEQPYEHISYTPNTNPYGQQGHGHYANQQQYANIGFAVDGQPAFSRNAGSLGPAQVVGQPHGNDYQQPSVQYGNSQNLNYRQYHAPEIVSHYSDFAQPQQHVGLNDFQQNSWAEPQSQHGSSNPYAHAQGQQFYGSNPALLRMATASPAQSSTPKSDQSQSSYQDPASLYQPQPYGGTYPTPQSTEIRHGYPTQVPLPAGLVSTKSNVTPTPSPGPTAAPHSVAWSSQAPAQRLGGAPIASASTRTPSVPRPPMNDLSRAGSKPSVPMTSIASNEPMIVVPRAGRPEGEWNSVKGCPNLFVGAKPVKRKIVTNTPGVKPHVAGDNRNGTPLLPLLPDSLPCEKLRENVRPIVDELKEVSESIDKSKEQIKNTSSGSEEHKRYTDDLKKAESRKASLESEKKKITGKAGMLKVGKSRATSKSDPADYDSESLTESSEEEDPQELIVQQIMASESRPTDPDKGVQYDVVKIIRNESGAEQGAASQGEREDAWSKVIGRRVAEFGKYVVDMCAEAKALREQKSTAPKTQSAQLQAAIDQKYDLVRLSLETALEFGDEETLRNMGQHMKLMSGLTIVLSRQFAIKSYNTAVPRTILRFISTATLMDLDVFNKVKLSSVLEKHRDSLDDEGKQLVVQISKNAEERTAKNAAEKPTVLTQPRPKSLDNAKESSTISQKTTTSVAKGPNTITKVQAPQSTNFAQAETARKETKNYSGLLSARKVANHGDKATPRASPIKRQRDDETDFRAAKKIAVESNTGGTGAGRAVSTSITNSAAPLNPTSQNGQTRPRPSGSTVLNKSRVAPKPPAKKPEPQSSVSSTISGLLAEIAKPAEKPKVQERTVKVLETPDERARRLRKESRRGRTVMWKPDDELVQIRFFEHDSTEDEGRAGNMIRDARDNRLEGQMLKQMQRNMQEGDDEDDDGNPAEMDLRPWATPQSFDYSLLENGQKGKNYVTRGGTRDIHSEQKKVMEEYENRELMSIYTTLSEIPETPRSPKKASEPAIQPTQALLPRDNPKGREIHQRWLETRQFGTVVAAQAAMQRLGISSHYGGSSTSASLNASPNMARSQPTTAAQMMTQEERDVQVLALLQSDRARNYVDPDPYDPANPRIIEPPKTSDEKVQKAFSILQSLVAEMKEKNPESTAPSRALQAAPTHLHENYAGYSQDPAKVKREEEYARQATNSAQSQYGAPQTAPFATYPAQAPQQPQTYSQLGPQVPDQYAAILRQVQALQNPQASQGTAVPQPAPAQPDNTVANLLATLSQTSQPAQTAAQDPWQAWAQSQAQSYGAQLQSQSYPSYSQQQYDGASREDGTYGSQKRDYTQYQQESSERGNRKDFRGTKDHKGINRALIGTKPCTFWAKGQCAKGDNCTFRHDPNDLK